MVVAVSLYTLYEHIVFTSSSSFSTLSLFLALDPVDYENARCVADCSTDTPGCGGIIATASVALFPDVATCCSNKLSYINPAMCASNSNPSSTGTGLYYANTAESICVEDTDGSRAPSNAVLFGDIEDCCEALPWVASAYCASRSDATLSGAWFVDYANEVCVQDCDSGVTCGNLTDPSTSLFETALGCCSSKLSYLNAAECAAYSEGTDPPPTTTAAPPTTTAYVPTELWFADTVNNMCGTSFHIVSLMSTINLVPYISFILFLFNSSRL